MNEAGGDVRALVEQVAKSLVDAPDQVSVNQLDGETTVFELRVAQPDMGKVIGKQGRVARAFRSLVDAAGVRSHKRYELEIVD